MNSQTVSQNSTLVRTKPRSSGINMRKTLTKSSDDGGDKDPLKKNIEKYHIVYTSMKIKMKTQIEGLGIHETK